MIELRRRYSGSKGSGSPSFSRLPKEYREVEYIESTGVQMLHLPTFNTNSDFNIEMSVSITEYSEWTPLLVSPARLNIWIGCHQDNFVLRSYSGVNIIATKKPDTNKFFSVKISRVNDVLSLYVDGALINSATYTFNVTSDFFVYFADSPFNPTYSKFKSKELKYDNYHFIPCYRISDHKPGMYDIVNDVFYVNQGIGEFLVGTDVHYNLPPEYQQVEYLGNGNGSVLPFIVTDIYPSKNLGFEIECSYPTDGPYESHILGCDVDWNRIGYKLMFDNKLSPLLGVVFHMRNSVTDPISYTSFIPTSNEFYKYKYINGYCFINGEIVKEGNFTSDVEINTQIALFGMLRGATVYHSGNYTRIKYISFFDSDESNVVAHLYPCYRKKDDRTGMYDIINSKFYESANESEFILGPEVIA